jgi:hypothetical protein
VLVGGIDKGIHGGTTAVASVDIGHHALSPRDQLVADTRLVEGCQLVGKLFAQRAEYPGCHHPTIVSEANTARRVACRD